MNVQTTTHIATAALAEAEGSIYASAQFEHMFDATEFGSEQTNAAQKSAEPTPHLLTATPGRGADSPVSREDMFAVKTAQMVAAYLADEARTAMASFGSEFNDAAFVLHAARTVANMTAPTFQPLTPSRRAEVADRAVDPDDHGDDLDVILDGVGRALRTYSDYLPNLRWLSVPTASTAPGGHEGTADARVVGWRRADGAVVLDLLDLYSPDRSPDDHLGEVADVLRVGRDRFGHFLFAVRYLPVYAMKQARVYYPGGDWDPYPATPPKPDLASALPEAA